MTEEEYYAMLRREYMPKRQLLPPTSTTASSTSSSTTSSTSTTSTTTSTGPTTSTTTTGPPDTSTPGTTSTTSTTTSSTTTTTSSTLPPTSTPPPPATTSTITQTAVPSVPLPSISGDSTTAPPAPTRSIAPTGFFHNTGAVAGTFSAVGVVVAVLAVVLLTTCIRRRRARKFDDDVAAAAAAAYRDADGYWEREDNWNNGAPSNSAYTPSAYTDGTHGAYNERPLPVPQGEYQNYHDGGYNTNYPGNGAGYQAHGGEAYGMSDLSQGNPGYGAAGVGAGVFAAGAGAAAYAANHNRQGWDNRQGPSPPPHDTYQGYPDMGMNDSLEGGRYPVPPVRSRSFNQGNQGQGGPPGMARSSSNSSSGHGGYGYQPNGGPLGSRSSSKSPPQAYTPGYGAPLPQMQEHHEEGDAYDGFTPESDHHGHGMDHDTEYGEVEDHPRILRVANE